MFVLIVGAGRVGSSLARAMLKEGHEVSCLDEDPESHARLEIGLDKPWEDKGGHFTVGPALEVEALIAAGIERADVFVASTDGDNTNIVIAQIATGRFKVPTVVARVLDPLSRQVVRGAGAAHDLPDQGRDRHARAARCGRRRTDRAVPVSGGVDHEDADAERRPRCPTSSTSSSSGPARSAGTSPASCSRRGSEVTLIESDRDRYLTVEQELEHNIQYGDASELWVLERAGISRADMVIAVTGDDEDNILICQVAKEKYLRRPDHRPGQQPP